MLAFGNTSGQDVESAPHCLPATRGHHSSYLTGYCLFRLLNLVAYVIRTCFYRIFTPFRLIFHMGEAMDAAGQKYKKKGLPFYFNEVVSPFHCKTGEIRYICEIINYFN